MADVASVLSLLDELQENLRVLAKEVEGHGADPVQSQTATELRTGDLRRIEAALVKLSSP